MILKLRREWDYLVAGLSHKDSFSRNFAFAFGGKVIIIIFTFLTTPLLTRLYSPEAYGYFSFVNIIASNVSMIATLGFPAALVVVKNDREFYNLSAVTLILCGVILVGFSVFFLVFADFMIPFSLGEYKSSYIALTVFGCLIFGLMQVFPKWYIWRNDFKRGAEVNVLVNGSSRVLSLLIGFFYAGYPLGMVVGDFLGRMLGLVENWFLHIRKEWTAIRAQLSTRRMQAVSLKYRRYPLFVLTGGYVGQLSGHIPLLVFPYFFDAGSFGNYSLAAALIAIPGNLLATPLSSVFLKKMATLNSESPEAIPAFLKRVIYNLSLASIPPFAAVVVFGPELFSLIFGPDWVFAGEVCAVLAMFGLVEMLQMTVQNVFLVFKVEKLVFSYNLIQLLVIIFSITPGILMRDPLLMVGGFTMGKILSGLLVVGRVLHLCHINYIVLFFRLAAVFIGVVGLFMMIKEGWVWIW